MKSATELDDPISFQLFWDSNKFLVIKFKKAWYVCLNFIEKVHFVNCLLKTEFKAKKLFARNWGIQLSN